MCRVRWARPSLVRLLRPRPPSRKLSRPATRRQPRCATTSQGWHTRAGHARWPHPVGPLASLWLNPLSVRSSFCVVALAIAAPEEPSSCPPPQKAMMQPTLSFGCRPVRPRLCADLPLVYRSVRTLAVRTHDRPARHRVKARTSHRRSIACAALLSFAGASRQAQHIRRRCATRPSAGLHSHAPRPMLKPDGGRSGGVSVSGCASRTRKHALVKSRVITMRH